MSRLIFIPLPAEVAHFPDPQGTTGNFTPFSVTPIQIKPYYD